MHWNKGRFHGAVTLEELNITDFKYNAITYGLDNNNKDTIYYGDTTICTEIKGNGINIISANQQDISINSNKNINIISGNKGNVSVASQGNVCINTSYASGEATANNKESKKIELNSASRLNLYSNNDSNINIISSRFIKLNPVLGILLDNDQSVNSAATTNTMYGSSLPSSGAKGQIFFKLIS